MADLLLEPLLIRFDGIDADNHEIDMSALGESLKGISRIFSVCGNFAATGRYVQHKDAMSIRVLASPPEAHCFEVMATLKWLSENPLISTAVGGMLVTLFAYVITRAAGKADEMRHLRGALDLAIKELGTRDQAAVERMLTTIDKMADALRPAARQTVAPIGTSARTLSVSNPANPDQSPVVVDAADKAAILSGDDVTVGPEDTFVVIITELDMDSGSCHVVLPEAPEDMDYTRISGKITDPAFGVPNNKYAMAMAAKEPLSVRAKPTFKEGAIERLFISDTD